MRLPALSCLAIVLAAAVAMGCGSAAPEVTTPAGDHLSVYSALPLHGPGARRALDVLDGERLALEGADGRAGAFDVHLRSLDDVTPEGKPQPGATLAAARLAVKDPTTIAYLGDFDAGPTAVSLAVTNADEVLQVTPGATYDGFTGGVGSGAGEPDKYQPSGVRTFGRVPPADAEQAQAIANVMQDDGCRRIAVLRAASAFEASLAALVADAVTHRQLPVVFADQVEASVDGHRQAAQQVLETAADCATFAATVTDQPAGLLRELHAAAPGLRIVTPMALADGELAAELGPAAAAVAMVGPPRPEAAFTAAFERRFGRRPGPWAPYGHEAMRRTLAAIERAGERGDERLAVARTYLRMPGPSSEMALWQPVPGGLRFVRELPVA